MSTCTCRTCYSCSAVSVGRRSLCRADAGQLVKSSFERFSNAPLLVCLSFTRQTHTGQSSRRVAEESSRQSQIFQPTKALLLLNRDARRIDQFLEGVAAFKFGARSKFDYSHTERHSLCCYSRLDVGGRIGACALEGAASELAAEFERHG